MAPAFLTRHLTPVEGVVLHQLPVVEERRGMLSYVEVARHVPFSVQRYFLVYRVPGGEVRGEHAHRTQHQFLVCVHGRCSVTVDDGHNRHEVKLDAPHIGLHISPMVWASQHHYSRDAVLLVLASDEYDPADYIQAYAEFVSLKT
jgi:UDP-2-acetamido-3-amino-2,3-dideoxy-glucuronate N-acetyltransferase